MRQIELRRLYLREQPVGTWVDKVPPWTTFATCEGIYKVNRDQCTTGLRDSQGVSIRERADMMANHRLLLAPFERKRCAGHHQRASVRNRALGLRNMPRRCSPFLSMQSRSHAIYS
eukprot:1532647-Pyramimonas_sp.AAC.1